MITSYLLALILFVFVVIVLYVYGGRPKLTFIEKPILGLLDLSGGASAAELEADRGAFGKLFYFIRESASWPPKCDVLFLYCHIEEDGRISGYESGLRDLIRESGAPIVVVAQENAPTAYIAAAKQTGYGFANLMMVIERKGEAFGRFFHKLFTAMHEGVSMPVAFVNLNAAAAPAADETVCPGILFNVEAGQIAFRAASPQTQSDRGLSS